MIFVDTGAWFAAFVPNDANHSAARDCIANVTEQGSSLVMSTYVLDELFTLLKARREHRRVGAVGRALLGNSPIVLEDVTRRDFVEGWAVFERYADKRWSFTDCTSLVLMRRLGIDTAVSFDRDFAQFGAVSVIPA